MQHVSDIDLIEYGAGRLPPERSAATAEHLAACAECRLRHEQTRRIWDRLGDWQAAHLDVDLAGAVVAQARRGRDADIRRASPRRWVGVVLGAAAAVLLAVGAGHLAGRWARPSRAAVVDENQVIGVLHLHELGVPSPVGLADPVLSPADNHGEEQR